jgi:3-hydroxyacyl-CoA dehydrogenase
MAEVSVECEGAIQGIECAVEHVEGGSAAEACWEPVFECANGTEVRGEACRTLEPDEYATRFIPETDLRGLRDCDQIIGGAVENVEVTD